MSEDELPQLHSEPLPLGARGSLEQVTDLRTSRRFRMRTFPDGEVLLYEWIPTRGFVFVDWFPDPLSAQVYLVNLLVATDG